MSKDIVTINARKHDGSIHRSWKADLIDKTDTLLTFVGVFDKEIVHPDLGTIAQGTISYEYYWLDRWYNVFRFHEPNGDFRNFYCNINMPPTFENGILNYIDLDIDVLVAEDLSYEVLDQDEFEANSKVYAYGVDTIEKAGSSLTDLLSLIEKKEFPFNHFDQLCA